jgi:hypothetical protein
VPGSTEISTRGLTDCDYLRWEFLQKDALILDVMRNGRPSVLTVIPVGRPRELQARGKDG